MIHWNTMTIPFAEHKNLKKRKTRTIYITPKLEALLRRKCQEHPTGFLFRNRLGSQWNSHDATRRLHYITDKLKIPSGTLYGMRHFYCTSALPRART